MQERSVKSPALASAVRKSHVMPHPDAPTVKGSLVFFVASRFGMVWPSHTTRELGAKYMISMAVPLRVG